MCVLLRGTKQKVAETDEDAGSVTPLVQSMPRKVRKTDTAEAKGKDDKTDKKDDNDSDTSDYTKPSKPSVEQEQMAG